MLLGDRSKRLCFSFSVCRENHEIEKIIKIRMAVHISLGPFFSIGRAATMTDEKKGLVAVVKMPNKALVSNVRTPSWRENVHNNSKLCSR